MDRTNFVMVRVSYHNNPLFAPRTRAHKGTGTSGLGPINHVKNSSQTLGPIILESLDWGFMIVANNL